MLLLVPPVPAAALAAPRAGKHPKQTTAQGTAAPAGRADKASRGSREGCCWGGPMPRHHRASAAPRLFWDRTHSSGVPGQRGNSELWAAFSSFPLPAEQHEPARQASQAEVLPCCLSFVSPRCFIPAETLFYANKSPHPLQASPALGPSNTRPPSPGVQRALQPVYPDFNRPLQLLQHCGVSTSSSDRSGGERASGPATAKALSH